MEAFALIQGGFVVRSPGFYGKAAESVASTGNAGIYVPLFVDVDPSVYVAMPTYTPTEKNTNGALLAYALWTQQTAVISALDKADIRNGLATQSTLLQRPTLAEIEQSAVIAKESTVTKTLTTTKFLALKG